MSLSSIPYSIKAWLNARNISTQHLATLLGTIATCCIRLATLLRYVAMYCNMLDDVGSNLKINGQIFRATFWMLHDVVLVWPRLRNIVALGHAR